jgi:hypothetical protein
MKRAGLGVLLAALWTATATAQTPLCAWNGASLSCPDRPAPMGPLTPQAQLGALPTPQQRLTQLQAQADFDRALIAARIAQDTARVTTLERADTLVSAGRCADAETLVREKAPAELATIASRCAAASR